MWKKISLGETSVRQKSDFTPNSTLIFDKNHIETNKSFDHIKRDPACASRRKRGNL